MSDGVQPRIGPLAEGIGEMVRAATESDGAVELVGVTLDAVLESLHFRRVAYLAYASGTLRLPRWRRAEDEDDIEIEVGGHPRLREVIEGGRASFFDSVSDPDLATLFARVLGGGGGRGAIVLVPVRRADEAVGLLVLAEPTAGRVDEPTLAIATVYGSLLGLGMAALARAERLEHLREVLQERNELLAEELSADTDACRTLEASVSRPMRRLVHSAKQVAATDAPVLITGETGSGKEVLARAIHEWSRRASGPLVQLNCAALSDHLIESELFGHEKGAFSGAVSARAGRFRVADGGTLLLDEIGEMPLDAQTKLLRVLEVGEVRPVGADHTIDVDVRVIAATNVDLDMAIDRGDFREDLYFRLNVFPLHLPPLRERTEDIPVLVDRLLARIQRRTGHGPWRISEAHMEELERYRWPGNVRELVNVLERARVFSPLGGTLGVRLGEESGGSRRRRGRARWPTMEEHQRTYMEEVLRHTRGKIYGEGGAAELLGLPASTLQSRMRRLGVERPEK